MYNINLLQKEIDIVEVIGSFIPLKKNGVGYVALCPFHDEKTPSLAVTQDKGLFYCFGCGFGGDSIEFVKKYKNVNLNDALNIIASICNIDLDKYNETQHLNKTFKVYGELNNIFKANLLKEDIFAQKIREYLYGRGLTKEDFDVFDIGLCLATKDLNNEYILNNAFFKFENRIMFGIRNKGRIIGFAGRQHKFSEFYGGKYVNSSNDNLYDKRRILYLLDKAIPSIKERKRAIIVEGYLDAIMAHKAGLTEVVAIAGTSFSINHLSCLLKISDDFKICFCLDNDESGKNATYKAIELCIRNRHFNVLALRLGDNMKDLAESKGVANLINLKGRDGFKYLLETKLKNAKNLHEKDNIISEYKNLAYSCEKYSRKYILDALDGIATSEYIQMANHNDLIRDVYGTMLMSKEFTNIAREFLVYDDMQDWSRSYANYIQSNTLDDKSQSLIANRDFNCIYDKDIFVECIKTIKIKQLQKKMTEYKLNRDVDNILKIQSKIKAINGALV